MKILKKFFFYVVVSCIAVIALFAVLNLFIDINSVGSLYSDVDSIPKKSTGLLLGTNKFIKKGVPNPFFSHRIEAAADLYNAGKVDRIIASGAVHSQYYNEPKQMRDELVKKGVPASAIIMDPAGFRTIDSVIRSRDVFGADDITVISQAFHNRRAIFMADRYGIKAIGFNAKDVDGTHGFKVRIREFFARVKAFIEMYIIEEYP